MENLLGFVRFGKETQFFYYASCQKYLPKAERSQSSSAGPDTSEAEPIEALPVPLENLYLLNPAAFCKKLLSGSLIHSLLSVDISAVRKSWDCPDKAPPGPQCPISSYLSQQLPARGPGVSVIVVNPPHPGFFNSLIWTGRSQPSLLPLITLKFPEGIFACWAPETQALRLFHNYRYAAQGLSRYSERLLLCVFAENYSSLH